MMRSCVLRSASVANLGPRARRSPCEPPLARPFASSALNSSPNKSSRTVAESRTEHLIPLGSDKDIRTKYVNHYGDCRVGLLLENLDLMAGAVSYKHTLGMDVHVAFFAPDRLKHGLTLSHPERGRVTIVTASADRIDRLAPIDVSQDVKIVGEVAVVGRSSMEIAIDMIGIETKKKLLSAQFTMVARDEYNKAYKVPTLECTTDEEKKRRDVFTERLNLRKKRSAESLLLTPPTAEERLVIHKLIYSDRKALEQMDKIVFERKFSNMDTTDRQSTVIMFPQKQNIHQKIFGGYLMRIAYEQAWANAFMFTGQRPSMQTIYEQTFHAPVEIGSICEFNSMITYTTEDTVQVEVETIVCSPDSLTRKTTNTFHLTFSFDAPIRRQVMPRLYDEAMKYIESKRRHESPKLTPL